MKAILILILMLVSQIFYSQSISTPQPTPPPGTNTTYYDSRSDSYIFKFLDGDEEKLRYTYSLNPNDGGGCLKALTVKVNNSYNFWASYGGGVALFVNNAINYAYQSNISYTLLNHSFENNIVTLNFKMRCTYIPSDDYVDYYFNYNLKIEGRTLILNVSKDDAQMNDIAIQFNLDRCENVVNPVIIGVPYLTLFNILYCDNSAYDNKVFTSMFFDWTRTEASRLEPLNENFSSTSARFSQFAVYNHKTNYVRNPLDETIYLTVSPTIEDVFPNLPNPVSPKKQESISTMVFDYWQTFDHGLTDLNTITNAGIGNLWWIVHVWQKAGYDVENPDVFPANDEWGGNDGLRNLRDAIVSNNFLFSLHEQYVEYRIKAPTYNEEVLARNPQGGLIPNWYEKGVVVGHVIKPTKIVDIINNPTRTPSIDLTFIPNASYIDANPSYDPSVWVDYDYTQTDAGTFKSVYNVNKCLGDLFRNYYDGPISGEGLAHFLYTGYYDDFCAQIHTAQSLPGIHYLHTNSVEIYGGFYKPILIDFDLLKMKPKALVHGVGYYSRFFYKDNNWGPSRDSALMYAATELAYGHGAFFSNGSYNMIEQGLIEYEHVYPMQLLYGNADINNILYNDNGIYLIASDYIKKYPNDFNCFPGILPDCNSDNFMSQVRIEYSNGVVVCVNRHPTKTWTVSDIPLSGWYNYHVIDMPLYTGETGLSNYPLPAGNGWVCYSPIPPSYNPKKFSVNKPGIFKLHQNYPNPFNPSTQITYEIPKDNFVTIKIYDVLGREVKILVNKEYKKQGLHEIKFDGKNLASGIYFYKIESGSYTDCKKMSLLK